MITLNFLSKDSSEMEVVEAGTDFIEWLIKSGFYQIGKSVPRKIIADGEEVTLDVVPLDKGNRKRLRDFLGETIIQESDIMFDKLGDVPSKQEYQEFKYRLTKLHELRKCVENEKYQYLQRV
ncbi:MAG: hypothetical protein SVX43_02895 [Cyanobacteriota bacterium]|nr:hypothetical protein [Cyanobacteriota bacterium]